MPLKFYFLKILLRIMGTENGCYIIFEPEVIDRKTHEKFGLYLFLSYKTILFISTKRLSLVVIV